MYSTLQPPGAWLKRASSPPPVEMASNMIHRELRALALADGLLMSVIRKRSTPSRLVVSSSYAEFAHRGRLCYAYPWHYLILSMVMIFSRRAGLDCSKLSLCTRKGRKKWEQPPARLRGVGAAYGPFPRRRQSHICPREFTARTARKTPSPLCRSDWRRWDTMGEELMLASSCPGACRWYDALERKGAA